MTTTIVICCLVLLLFASALWAFVIVKGKKVSIKAWHKNSGFHFTKEE